MDSQIDRWMYLFTHLKISQAFFTSSSNDSGNSITATIILIEMKTLSHSHGTITLLGQIIIFSANDQTKIKIVFNHVSVWEWDDLNFYEFH